MLNDSEKLNRIEELKTKLGSKSYESKIKPRDNFTHLNKKVVLDSWVKKEESDMTFTEKYFQKTSSFKKFFIFSTVFFVLALSFSAYSIFLKGNTISNDNIEISVLGNAFTGGGEELPLQIEVVNKNSSSLQLADLLVEYPRGSLVDFSKEVDRLRVSLGTIPAGGTRSENIKVILFGEQGSVKPMKITLEYRVDGSNAIFVKEKPYEVSISSTPINLSVKAPTEISSNQDIMIDISATLNANKPAEKILIKVDYPVGFDYSSSLPAPTIGNNIWNLGDLSPGTERKISIIGKLTEVSDGEEKTFRVWTGAEKTNDKSQIGTIFNSVGHTIVVKKSFIEAKLYVNGVYNKEYAVNSKKEIVGEIRYANNLETQIKDFEIKAVISGNAVNRREIKPDTGYYDSSTDTIIWNKNSDREFGELGPGRSGSVKFSLGSLPLIVGSSEMLEDPSIRVDVSVSGKELSTGYDNTALENQESKIIKIISDLGFAGKILHYSGAFKNTGFIPPKVEEKTTYTVVWTVSNSANAISNAQIKSSLPPWVSFVGAVFPPSEELTFNPSTKELLWNIGRLSRGTGIGSLGREVSFQIELLPSLSQLGTAPTLVNDAVLTGMDDFAMVEVRVNKASLDTKLGNDPTAPLISDRVVE